MTKKEENAFTQVKRGAGLKTPPKPKATTQKTLPKEGEEAVKEKKARNHRVSTYIYDDIGDKIPMVQLAMKRELGRKVSIGELLEAGILALEKQYRK